MPQLCSYLLFGLFFRNTERPSNRDVLKCVGFPSLPSKALKYREMCLQPTHTGPSPLRTVIEQRGQIYSELQLHYRSQLHPSSESIRNHVKLLLIRKHRVLRSGAVGRIGRWIGTVWLE